MEVPKEDKIHVLKAKVKPKPFFNNIRAATSLISCFLVGFGVGMVVTPPVSILFAFISLPGLIIFWTIALAYWPFWVTKTDWLMWKATQAEG